MKIKGFKAWRPDEIFVKDVASVPYDVVNYDEAQLLSKGNPKSFLNVVRADINFPKDYDPYSDEVYKKAKYTKPTGLAGLPPDGPAIPVTAKEKFTPLSLLDKPFTI